MNKARKGFLTHPNNYEKKQGKGQFPKRREGRVPGCNVFVPSSALSYFSSYCVLELGYFGNNNYKGECISNAGKCK